MTDNKDPQITAEMVQKWLETFSSYEDMYDGTIDATDIARAFLQQAAELSQLRAERAGLLVWIDVEIIRSKQNCELNKCRPSSYLYGYTKGMTDALTDTKSKLTDASSSNGRTPDFDSGDCGSNPREATKLTDSAQRGEGE